MDAEAVELANTVLDLARDGDAQTLATYLQHGLSPDLTDARGNTLLILASYHEHGDAVRALLAAGADHARVNDRGQTALGSAVFRKDASTVRALLDAGADPDAGAPSAVELARFFELPAMLALLQDGSGRAGGEAAG